MPSPAAQLGSLLEVKNQLLGKVEVRYLKKPRQITDEAQY